MVGPWSRIIIRYLAGYLVAHGILSGDMGSMITDDPDLAMLLESGLGLATGVAVEGWYWFAKRWGWKT